MGATNILRNYCAAMLNRTCNIPQHRKGHVDCVFNQLASASGNHFLNYESNCLWDLVDRRCRKLALARSCRAPVSRTTRRRRTVTFDAPLST